MRLPKHNVFPSWGECLQCTMNWFVRGGSNFWVGGPHSTLFFNIKLNEMRIWFLLTLAAFGSERVKVVQQNSAIWPNYNQIIWWVHLLMTILRVHFLLIPLKKLNPEEQHIIYKLFCHNEGSMGFTFYFQIFSKNRMCLFFFVCG